MIRSGSLRCRHFLIGFQHHQRRQCISFVDKYHNFSTTATQQQQQQQQQKNQIMQHNNDVD